MLARLKSRNDGVEGLRLETNLDAQLGSDGRNQVDLKTGRLVLGVIELHRSVRNFRTHAQALGLGGSR